MSVKSIVPAAVIGILLLALQTAGGAWNAEFDGYPDEAAQFVTGRMIWEYVSDLPSGSPIEWAEQYYLHYPKVGLGHWPPAYHVAEALWSFVFGSSRVSAIWLQWILGLASLTGLYAIARPRFPTAVTWAIVLFAMASPVFQQGLEQTMAELSCLLCSILFILASLQLFKHSDYLTNAAVAAVIVVAIAVKGTGVCLIGVPFLILSVAGQRTPWRIWWFLTATAGVLIILVFWLKGGNSIAYWSGMKTSFIWPVAALGGLLGWGFAGLAIFGLRRDPLAIVAACIILSSIVTSFALRAMNEPRHWIMVLPPLLLLAGYAVSTLPRWLAALLAGMAILLFPWRFYHQTPAGYADLIRQLHLPSRVLVSSGRGAIGEGGWVAEMSIAERYPASFVVRASKLLSESGWNGEHYLLLAPDTKAVEKILDEVAIDVVVLEAPRANFPTHHVLLASAMATSPSWKACGQTNNILAWCRIQPPRFLRKPLVMKFGGWLATEKFSRR